MQMRNMHYAAGKSYRMIGKLLSENVQIQIALEVGPTPTGSKSA